MKSCEQCIQYNVCRDEYKDKLRCSEFKNKADYVEVVRCKDCKHGHWNQETLFGRCVDFCDFTDLRINKDHFCSYGERK